MTANLRPMTLGEILDRTLQIYRARFLVFSGIVAVPAVVMLALTILNQIWWKLRVPFSPLRFMMFGISDLVYVLAVYHISLILSILSWTCCVYVASKVYLGEPASSVAAFVHCRRRLRSWLGLTGLFWVEVLLLPEIIGAVFWLGLLALLSEVIKLDSDTMDAVIEPITIILTTLAWSASLWIGGVLACGIPLWVVEKTQIRAALRRARRLSRESRWRIIFTRLAAAFLSWILTAILSSTCLVVVFYGIGHNPHFWSQQRNIIASVRLFSSAAVAILIGPIFPIALMLIYYDQRIRQEGFDIEMMMEAAGMNAPAIAAPADVPVAAAETEERPA